MNEYIFSQIENQQKNMTELSNLLSADITTVLLFLVVFCAMYLFLLDNRSKDFPPGPKPFPVIGNLTLLAGDPNNVPSTLQKLSKTYGDILGLKLGQHPTVVLGSLDAVKEAFVRNGATFSNRPHNLVMETLSAKEGKMRGVVFTSGETWKKMRRFALTTLRDFGFGKQSIEAKIQEECKELCDLITKLSKKPFDPTNHFQAAVSNVICNLCFGSRFETEDKDFNSLLELFRYIASCDLFTSPLNFFPVLEYLPKPTWLKNVSKHLDDTDTWLAKIVQDHRNNFDPNNPRDLVDVYLQNTMENGDEEILKPINIIHVIRDLFIAGTETSATSLSWFILHMIHYPQVQKKCQKDVDEILGGRNPSLSDRKNLPFIEAVMNECQRMKPLLPLGLAHSSTKDTFIYNYSIPKGTTVMPNVASIHMSEKYWTKPREFKPERWITDGKFQKKDAFITFGMGPRSCLGESLARNEMFLFFTSLIQRFSFRPVDDKNLPTLEGKFGTTLVPYPHQVIAECR